MFGFIRPLQVEQGDRSDGGGYHIHAAYFFNGNEVQGDVYKAIQLGELWEDITHGQGYVHSCNYDKEKYGDECGIGRILRSDRAIRRHVHKVVRYLVKDAQHLRLRPKGARCLRTGQVKHSRRGGWQDVVSWIPVTRSSVHRAVLEEGAETLVVLPASRLGNQFMEPQFELDDAHANYALGLQSGMRISLICTGGGDVAKRRCPRIAPRPTESRSKAQQVGSGSIRFRRLKFVICINRIFLWLLRFLAIRAQKSSQLIAFLPSQN